jgi:hypothetical protein
MFFLLLVVGISVVGCTLVYLRQRQPRSVESGIRNFRRGVEALATLPGPEQDDTGAVIAAAPDPARDRPRRP